VTGRVPRRITPRPRGRLFRIYSILFGTTRPAMWFSRNVLWHLDPLLLRATGGRFSLGPGTPTLLLETTGARTGQPRAHAVIYFNDGDDLIVVASKFGEPQHPAWFHNVRRNRDVRVNGIPYRATAVEGEAELDRLWSMADQVLPAYAVYRDRAAEAGRTIPVLRLSAASVGTGRRMPHDEQVGRRAELLPEEKRVGSDDPEAQAEAILEDSEARKQSRDASPGTHLEHRTSDEATPPVE
jgi:deazaflavin-dependent oxidoreductase (nitroreductase family)